MKFRFLRTTASGRPDFPFVAGQVIDVSEPTTDMLAWLKVDPDGSRSAEVVGEDAPEAAVMVPEPEQTILPRAGRRARGAVVSHE